MSWMQMLCDTYDYALSCGAARRQPNPLPEIGFVVERAAIEVWLDKDGLFQDAISPSPEDCYTMVPCTPESGVARGAPVKPHPIFDKAKYLGTPEQLELLCQWCNEPDTPAPVQLVYTYLKTGTLLADLGECLTKKDVKWSEGDLVRFCVTDGSLESPNLWQREDVLESWRQRFRRLCALLESGECYVTGKTGALAAKHPFGTGTAMLISMMNQNCAGRFESSAGEAVAVGLESTMKAHSARKWLMSRQGTNVFGLEFLAWDTRGFAAPNPLEYDPDEDVIADTGATDGGALAAGTWGRWSGPLGRVMDARSDMRSTVVILSVDCATPGRASIVYYQEFEPKDYIENLSSWYDSCKWIKSVKGDDGQRRERAFTPKPRDIEDLLYGPGGAEGQKKLKKQLVKELLPCISARRPLPAPLVMAAFRKTVNALSFKDRNGRWDEWAWRNALSITCALSRKYAIDKGDERPMSLCETERDRDYLFGRLLAVADEIEQKALKQGESSRTTNATRYMNRFQQRPGETWTMLRCQKLQPYIDKLPPSARSWYQGRLLSLPTRGAWIEILGNRLLRFVSALSLPTRGAWIEMDTSFLR
jgi:CRISPR-associated protein Csd1